MNERQEPGLNNQDSHVWALHRVVTYIDANLDEAMVASKDGPDAIARGSIPKRKRSKYKKKKKKKKTNYYPALTPE